LEVATGQERYLIAQGVKEHLVRSPLDWPGVHCVWPLANGKWQLDGWWDDQTAAYRARMRGEKTKRNEFRETETLTLSPLPAGNIAPKRRSAPSGHGPGAGTRS